MKNLLYSILAVLFLSLSVACSSDDSSSSSCSGLASSGMAAWNAYQADKTDANCKKVANIIAQLEKAECDDELGQLPEGAENLPCSSTGEGEGEGEGEGDCSDLISEGLDAKGAYDEDPSYENCVALKSIAQQLIVADCDTNGLAEQAAQLNCEE